MFEGEIRSDLSAEAGGIDEIVCSTVFVAGFCHAG